jgi:hypothetical protein
MPGVTAKGRMQRYCFVIMGFGVKTDFQTGRSFDLDKTYRNIIKPAVEAAGLDCIRADEIAHSGTIEQPMFNRLLEADVVVADLSTANTHALYELGVRHALRPYTTIVIAEDKFWAVPFDVVNVPIRRYKHLGEDIGYDEATRFRRDLTTAISTALEKDPPPTDSPVYTFLPELSPPSLRTKRTVEVPPLAGVDETDSPQSSTSELLKLANEAQHKGDFLTAKRLFTFIRETLPPPSPPSPPLLGNAYYVQKIALVTYKSKLPTELEALQEARDLLSTLRPAVSLDPETLGLWGAVHKRLWDVTGEAHYLDTALDGYERAFCVGRDYYNGNVFALLLNVRSARANSRAEAITDFVQAIRVRRQVIVLCDEALSRDGLTEYGRYWVQAAKAEAYLGVGDGSRAQETLQKAVAPDPWMKDSAEEQLRLLGRLLEKSPLDSL